MRGQKQVTGDGTAEEGLIGTKVHHQKEKGKTAQKVN